MKLPFEMIYPTAQALFYAWISAKDKDERSGFRKRFLTYLDAVGWTEQELDQRLLQQVDKDWEPPTN